MSPSLLPAPLAYALFATFALLLPGVALQRLVRAPIEPALVIPLGTAWCAGSFWLASWAGLPWLFALGLGLSLIGCLLPRQAWRLAPGPSLRGALPPILAIAAVLALAQYRFNRLGSDGDFLLDPLVTSDSAFHVGLTRELALSPTPQLPGVAGFPIGYHLGTDLVRAAALVWARIDPWDSLTRFDVTLYAVALVLGLRALTALIGGSPTAVALVPWTLLLTDLSFLFGFNPQAHWWADLFRGNLLVSLCYANPIMPALALVLASLVALSRHASEGGRAQLALATLLAAAVPCFKVFLGAQLLLGLGIAFVLARPGARRALLALALPCALATALLALGQGGRSVDVTIAPFDLAAVTRETLGLAPLAGLRLLAWGAVWIVVSLGVRLLAVPEAARSLRGTVSASTLSALALSGWPLGLLFRVSAPEALPGQRLVNDAAYLVEQSGPVLWLFTVVALAGLARARRDASAPRRRGRVLALAAALLVSLPSTVQYVVKKARLAPDRLPAPMVRAMADLVRVSLPGEVVLQRPGARYPPAPVILAGRRVPYERFTPYLTQFASPQALEARHEQVYRFFQTGDRAEALAIARSLGARYLALYGRDRVRFQTAGLLEPIHEEDGARLYRLRFPDNPS